VKNPLTGIAALIIGAACGVAQAGDSYDATGRWISRTVFHGNGGSSSSGVDGVYHSVSRGNCAAGACTAQTYDASGRHVGTSFRRGNTHYI
jgi:hypothetical protein